ncbi:hypothetical protein ACLMAL_20580 [Nocardia sp. CWNU-33]
MTALSDGACDARTIELVEESAATAVAGQGIVAEPSWHWPKR